MRKKSRSYKSAKRGKELRRQEKQEEKRKKRLTKGKTPQETGGESADDEHSPD